MSELARPDEALVTLEQSLSLENNESDVWLLKGTIQLDQEHLEEALDSFDRALALSPEDSAASYRKGKAYAGLAGMLKR